MKVIIVKTFRDKDTKKLYNPGEEVEFLPGRVTEINKKLPGYIEVASPDPEAEEKGEDIVDADGQPAVAPTETPKVSKASKK